MKTQSFILLMTVTLGLVAAGTYATLTQSQRLL